MCGRGYAYCITLIGRFVEAATLPTLLSSMLRFYLPYALCYVLAPHDSNVDLKSHTHKSVDCFARCIMPLYGSEPKETTQAKHVINHGARA